MAETTAAVVDIVEQLTPRLPDEGNRGELG